MKTKFTKAQLVIAGVIAAYFVGTITQNMIATKTFELFGVSTVAAGVLITWIAFAANDVLTEIMGRAFAIKCILIGAVLNLVFCGICEIAVLLPGNNDFIADCFAVIFGSTWRISLASAIAYIGGGYVNTRIMDRLHQRDGEKGYTFRAIVSTVVGQLIDDYAFIFLAFAPLGISAIEHPWSAIAIMPLFSLGVETLTGILSTPLAKKIVEKVREYDT